MVDHLGATLARGIRLEQRALGGDGREPLVPEGDRQVGQPREVAGEGAGRLRPRPLAAVHVARQPEHQPADPPRRGEREQRGGVGARTSCAGSSRAARRCAGRCRRPRRRWCGCRGRAPSAPGPAAAPRRRRRRRRGRSRSRPSPASRPAASIAASAAGVAGVLAARLGEDRRRLVAAAEHAERADQPRPVRGRAALGRQPLARAAPTMPSIIACRSSGVICRGRVDVGGVRARRRPPAAADPASRAASATPGLRGRRSRARPAGPRRRAATRCGRRGPAGRPAAA